MIYIGGSLEGVGSGLRDGVDTSSDEVGLAHVKRRNDNLNLLDGIDGDRAAAAREAGRKAEVVVEIGSVDSEVGGTSVDA